MKTIKLTNSDQVALVDDDLFDELNKYTWRITPKGYAACGKRISGKYINIRMHRLVVGLTDPNIQCDHINCNKLDNQRINLRSATNGQNQQNRAINTYKTTKTTSKYKGVHWYPNYQKWHACIQHNHIGYFETELEAAKAYNQKAIELFGEFVRINEI